MLIVLYIENKKERNERKAYVAKRYFIQLKFMDNEMREKSVEWKRRQSEQANSHNRSLECME